MARRHRPSGVGTKTSGGDFVSDADRASEAAVVEVIAGARPDDGFLGEEGADRESASGVRWVIDPLDGTANYLYGLDGWAVSVAAEGMEGEGWSTLVGVVYHPVSGEMFTARRGAGARSNGIALEVNDPVARRSALVGTGFSYDYEVRRSQGPLAGRMLLEVRDLRRIGAAALDLCLVAAGRLDAFYESDLQAWDYAAGALIAREAGAVVSPFENGVLAAGPALHEDLATLIRRYTPPDG